MPPPIRRLREGYQGVETFDDLVRLARQVLARVGGVVEERSGRRRAMINAGRWVVMCPHCNNGILADPDWGRLVCVDCGGIYEVDYPPPPERQAIEEALMPRPENRRNWMPHESAADLLEENRAHGLEPSEEA